MKKLCSWPRFEKEAQGSSKIAYSLKKRVESTQHVGRLKGCPRKLRYVMLCYVM